jgi:hypothetical protein
MPWSIHFIFWPFPFPLQRGDLILQYMEAMVQGPTSLHPLVSDFFKEIE